MATQPKKVAVSYAWKEEGGGENAGLVGSFCERLRSVGIETVRDVDRLKHGQEIHRFMRDIGAADLLCVFLSDAYLKSPNCMYELLVAWQRSKDNPEEFRSRVRVWLMPCAKGIRDTAIRLGYLQHWLDEKERVEPLIVEYVSRGLAPAELESFDRIKEFAEHVNGMLCFVADTLLPADMEGFEQWVLEQFPDRTAQSDAAQLEAVYENILRGMEAALNAHPKCQQFLAGATKGLICKDSDGWKLAASVKGRSFDASPILKGIKLGLPGFMGSRSDWNVLEEIIGGIVALAVNPGWILKQRGLLQSGLIEFPALKEFVPLGGGQRANFLSLVAAALADGRTRLIRIFGEPGSYDRRMSDLPGTLKGVTECDQLTELKSHFVRYVLGPEIEVDLARPEMLEQLFQRVKDVQRYAREEERDPYVGTGPNFRKLNGAIRNGLKLADLLLIQPSGKGSEDDVMTNPVFVLKHLHDIHRLIESRRPTSS